MKNPLTQLEHPYCTEYPMGCSICMNRCYEDSHLFPEGKDGCDCGAQGPLEKKALEAIIEADRLIRMPGSGIPSRECVERIRQAIEDIGFRKGYRAGVMACSDELKEYRLAYAEDIFMPIDESKPNSISRDRIAGHVARFILDNSIRDCEALLDPEGKEGK